MFPPLLLTLSILTQSSLVAADSSITWLQPQRSVIVKLDTPGHDFKELSEVHGSDRTEFPMGAVLLKFEMSTDNKTLLLDDTPILPLQNYYIPPRISAYQVPADIQQSAILAFAQGSEEARFIVGRLLELDYDRLVEGDPTGGPPFYNHAPILQFRIMGVGTHAKDDVLDARKQDVIQIKLHDRNNGASNDPLRSYAISSVDILTAEDVYAALSTDDHMGPEADQEKECTRRNWKCPDEGVFEAGSPYRTPYRFIWRRRFDNYGRTGSLRHDFVEQWEISKQKAYDDPLNSALVALGILLATLLAIVGGVKSLPKPSVSVKEPPTKPVKEKKQAAVEGEEEDEEEAESEDEDAAWLSEQAQQAGEVGMTVDEASQLIDLMSDDEEDEFNIAIKDQIKDKKAKDEKGKKKTNKRVAFKSNDDG